MDIEILNIWLQHFVVMKNAVYLNNTYYVDKYTIYIDILNHFHSLKLVATVSSI